MPGQRRVQVCARFESTTAQFSPRRHQRRVPLRGGGAGGVSAWTWVFLRHMGAVGGNVRVLSPVRQAAGGLAPLYQSGEYLRPRGRRRRSREVFGEVEMPSAPNVVLGGRVIKRTTRKATNAPSDDARARGTTFKIESRKFQNDLVTGEVEPRAPSALRVSPRLPLPRRVRLVPVPPFPRARRRNRPSRSRFPPRGSASTR